jgi:hypothetical protein
MSSSTGDSNPWSLGYGELGATGGARCDRIGSVGENSDEGDSLIRAEISLIADLNSLQGR